MLLISLLLIPLAGVFAITFTSGYNNSVTKIKYTKTIALTASTVNLFISLAVFILFNFSSNQFQFVQEYHNISNFDLYLGVDGVSIYFVLLTTMIMPISLLSNWSSISEDIRPYIVIILLLETLLLAVFLALDILLFYIFFESILPPLFLLIGIFGSNNRVRASFYLFLYTLLGSLFLLLSILTISSIMGTTDYDALYKTNFFFYSQIFLFCGIFLAFAVKTPTIFLNTWLLKAHVESPLGGSIILAGIVLKLSLYGIFRLMLPLIPRASLYFTPVVYMIGVITILYASLSTLRTIDIKELIAYSSVSHAAVYLLGVFSNTILGIEGGILLGLGHGFVSSGLFICAGGVLYDRSSTRLITLYRGMAQVMPVFCILFFILCLANAGTPLSLNFIGEFMSLYGTFERLPLLGTFACSSIVFSAAYTIYMFNRLAFAGPFSKFFKFNLPDLSKREFAILLTLVFSTVLFGVYPAPLLDGLHYSVSCLIYNDSSVYLSFVVWTRSATSRINKVLNHLMKNRDRLNSVSVFDSASAVYRNIYCLAFIMVCTISLKQFIVSVLRFYGFNVALLYPTGDIATIALVMVYLFLIIGVMIGNINKHQLVTHFILKLIYLLLVFVIYYVCGFGAICLIDICVIPLSWVLIGESAGMPSGSAGPSSGAGGGYGGGGGGGGNGDRITLAPDSQHRKRNRGNFSLPNNILHEHNAYRESMSRDQDWRDNLFYNGRKGSQCRDLFNQYSADIETLNANPAYRDGVRLRHVFASRYYAARDREILENSLTSTLPSWFRSLNIKNEFVRQDSRGVNKLDDMKSFVFSNLQG